MKTLYIVRGIPGSGKSTLAASICDTVYSADMYFESADGDYDFDHKQLGKAHEWCRHMVENEMAFGGDVAVANTFVKESEIKPYTDLAERYGYTVFSMIVENRHGNKNIHDVPEHTLERMRNNFSVRLG